MDDTELRQLVIDELGFEPGIEAPASVGVTAEDGIVTLNGHVGDHAQTAAAERAAWRVKGVRGIVQHIEVSLPCDRKPGDREIAQRVVTTPCRMGWFRRTASACRYPAAGLRFRAA